LSRMWMSMRRLVADSSVNSWRDVAPRLADPLGKGQARTDTTST
jgi:hypothetical protein